MKEIKIYMAGKVSTDDKESRDTYKNWRQQLLNKDFNSFCDTYSWQDLEFEFLPTLFYVGPFVVSCDHGCGHEPYSHVNGGYCSPDYHVVSKCLMAIKRCDCVFAWIDSLDCYATFLEIGFALSLKKRVFVGIDIKLKDELSRANNKNHKNNPHIPPSSLGSHDLWFFEEVVYKFAFESSPLDFFKKCFICKNIWDLYL